MGYPSFSPRVLVHIGRLYKGELEKVSQSVRLINARSFWIHYHYLRIKMIRHPCLDSYSSIKHYSATLLFRLSKENLRNPSSTYHFSYHVIIENIPNNPDYSRYTKYYI